MIFIIALGIIIILLCSASVFKLIQPSIEQRARKIKTQKIKQQQASAVKRKEPETFVQPVVLPQQQHKPEIAPTQQSTPVVEKPAVSSEEARYEEVSVPAVISIQLCASAEKPYAGYELLQALLSVGMRFGAMNMFHRHEKKTGLGAILFTLASCTKEGTFDLASISNFSGRGLVLFMKPKEVEDPVAVFELMLQTADQLINELGGKVLNEKQQLLKKEDVLHIHKTLRAYMHHKKQCVL